NYAPILNLNDAFLRSTINTRGLPGLTYFPHVANVGIDGPFNAAGAIDTPSRRKIFVCRPADATQETACAQQIISTLVRRAYRRPATPEDLASLMDFYQSGRSGGNFDKGIEMVLQRILAAPKFIYRIESEPAAVAAGRTYRITDL